MPRVQVRPRAERRPLPDHPHRNARRPVWTVSDDWPEDIPVTDAEIAAFEAWFGDLFDELFGSTCIS